LHGLIVPQKNVARHPESCGTSPELNRLPNHNSTLATVPSTTLKPRSIAFHRETVVLFA
jgi:hypothetical protein